MGGELVWMIFEWYFCSKFCCLISECFCSFEIQTYEQSLEHIPYFSFSELGFYFTRQKITQIPRTCPFPAKILGILKRQCFIMILLDERTWYLHHIHDDVSSWCFTFQSFCFIMLFHVWKFLNLAWPKFSLETVLLGHFLAWAARFWLVED